MDTRKRHYLPLILLFLAAIVSITPVPFSFNSMMPCFPLITVFYWGLLRPSSLHAAGIFVAGLILDAFTSPALGINILCLLLMRILTGRYTSRFARQTIWYFWGGFLCMSLPCWLLYWCSASLVSGHLLSLWPALMQWGFTALWYPLLHLLFTRSLAILPHTR